jgi:hypothetical protein
VFRLTQDTWPVLLQRWLQALFPSLADHNYNMAKGNRGVMTISIDVDEMQQMLAGTGLLLDPIGFRPTSSSVTLGKPPAA